ncbi:hypothetical protein [Nisaea sediminum]|uniref:hypothetical protein n=1 Tax=Nisaea sediminum TaxID=2775867 RepID=UPI0018660801|nr:hypothetical protein [Nisaea sediminum]
MTIEGTVEGGDHEAHCVMLLLGLRAKGYEVELPRHALDVLGNAFSGAVEAILEGRNSRDVSDALAKGLGVVGSSGPSDLQYFSEHWRSHLRVEAIAYYRAKQGLSIREAAIRASDDWPELGGADVIRKAWEGRAKSWTDANGQVHKSPLVGERWAENGHGRELIERFSKRI